MSFMPSAGPRIAVTPPPVCQHPTLRAEILQAFPQAVFNTENRYLSQAELIRLADGVEGLLGGREVIDDAVLDALPQLRIVSKYGVGLDNIDQEALSRRGVALGWTGGVNRRSVAELTLAFMLSLCHNVFLAGEALKRGDWYKQGGVELRGKHIGVIGCGHIGSEVVRLLAPFECPVRVHDILDKTEFCRQTGAEPASFGQVIETADILTLHVPLTESTRRMIDAEVLRRMKPTAFLINTSRGGVVDQAALKQALKTGRLAGAALDVFAQEPPEDLEFLQLPNLMVTPHIGGNTREAVLAMGRAALDHLNRFFGVRV